jgi:hypothetical protein
MLTCNRTGGPAPGIADSQRQSRKREAVASVAAGTAKKIDDQERFPVRGSVEADRMTQRPRPNPSLGVVAEWWGPRGEFLVLSRGATAELSPRRKPREMSVKMPKPRRGDRRPVRRQFCRPSGASVLVSEGIPRLTPRAKFCRPSGPEEPYRASGHPLNPRPHPSSPLSGHRIPADPQIDEMTYPHDLIGLITEHTGCTSPRA